MPASSGWAASSRRPSARPSWESTAPRSCCATRRGAPSPPASRTTARPGRRRWTRRRIWGGAPATPSNWPGRSGTAATTGCRTRRGRSRPAPRPPSPASPRRGTATARPWGGTGTGVAVGANVSAKFSVPITGVTGTTFALRTAAGKAVPAALGYNGATRVLTLAPTGNLAADTRYTVTLPGGPAGIRDDVDNPLATTTWSFVTGAAPAVVALSPASGATGVSVSTNVAARFSEAVRGASGSFFQLRTPTGKAVPAALSYDSSTRVLTLNPTANLARGTRYTVVVIGGPTAIRDGAGNPLK